MEFKILRALKRHGEMSQTELYRCFHRYRAQRKNIAVKNLLKTGFIVLEKKRLQPKARKHTHTFTLSETGIKFLAEHPLMQLEARTKQSSI